MYNPKGENERNKNDIKTRVYGEVSAIDHCHIESMRNWAVNVQDNNRKYVF
jgi:hypothetical protein